ncbi:topology modulation protein [Planococcus kocurii]|uniref:Topology modulation protein n=1 Tax=Planococcus kocurii TaxID=1374 RepID=A0ABM5WZS2_9BACL|nr:MULTISPECIES: topology modulation protein [Planococcus]ALS79837.1 topology modulation protein [Planococcus kocurii]KAA0957247.1 topology modulation protein [Planococcus sp. ANT_H30]
MERIIVLGVSSGVGKSSFARRLAEQLAIPVYHLDTYFWKPGWVESSHEEFSENQKNLVDQQCWIIEGNYSTTYDIRRKRADTIIYLERPLAVCLYRVVKRRIMYHGKNRPDMASGCPEKLDRGFFTFIISTYRARKVKMRKRLAQFIEESPQNSVFFLRNQQDIDEFLKEKATTSISDF